MNDILLGILIFFEVTKWYKGSATVKRFKSWKDLRRRKRLQPVEKIEVEDKLGHYRKVD